MADPGYDKSIADTWASMQATGVAGVARRRMVHDDDEEMRNPYEDPPVITQLSQSPNQSPNVEQLIQHSNTHPNLSDLAAYVPFINGEGEERTQSATELAYNAHARSTSFLIIQKDPTVLTTFSNNLLMRVP